jgi:hypothetical protein
MTREAKHCCSEVKTEATIYLTLGHSMPKAGANYPQQSRRQHDATT